MRLTISLRLIAALVLLWVVPCHGQMTTLGAGGTKSAAVAFSLAYQSSALSGSPVSGSTYDYGTLSYGSGCTRVVVANIWAAGGTTITGITIGGVSLAQVSSAYAITGSATASDVWESSAALAGSSGDVQVTYSATLSFTSSVALYCLKTTTPTASAANGTNSATTTVSSSVSVPAGGGAIVLTGNVNGNATSSGPTNTTVDVDTMPGGFHDYFGHTTSTGTVSVSATYGTGGNILSLVSWGP